MRVLIFSVDVANKKRAELESWAHSPPFQGGVAARLQEMAPFLHWRSRGGSYPTHNHPGRSLGVAATPPWKGGECPRFQFIHSSIDRATVRKATRSNPRKFAQSSS